MKILLFNPPTPEGKRFIREGRCTQEEGAWGTLWPPLSLATAAAVLERAGYAVKLRDFPAEGAGLREFEKVVVAFRPDVAIWSSATPSLNSDLAFAASLKAMLPGVITCTFGTHVGTLSRECFEAYPQLDYIIRGEPELTVQDLIEALEGKKAVGSVPGLAFMRDEKEWVITEPRALPTLTCVGLQPVVALGTQAVPLTSPAKLLITPLGATLRTCSLYVSTMNRLPTESTTTPKGADN